jgi:TRAP-type C4-dicarboxylate transport system permease small subunit
MKAKFERWLGTIFGLLFLGLSVVIAVETIARKFFNFSLQGANELGGYALAVGATIAFTMAVFGRNHIRIDVFHDRFPARIQVALNWLSIAFLAGFALLMAWLSFRVLADTLDYQSVSQTPWATPLKYPQFAWVVGQAIFALVTVLYLIRATWLLAKGRIAEMNRDFHPKSTKEELHEELDDLASRTGSTQAAHLTAREAT